MDIRPIRNDHDHEEALREIERLWGAEPGTPDGDKLDVLATLLEAYEDTRWPVDAVDPIDVIKAHMEANAISQKELGIVLRSPPRASEILNRKRALTVDMIHRLHSEWHLPAEILIQPYHLAAAGRQRRSPKGSSGSGAPRR